MALRKMEHSSASLELVRPSERRLNVADSNALTVLLDQMSAAYPNQEFGTETADVWREAIELLALRHGLARLRAVLAAFLVKQKFFPHPAEIEEALQDMRATEREQARRDNPFTPCGQCEGGMIAVNKDGTPWDWHTEGPRYMRDCQCKIAWRSRMKAAIADGDQSPDQSRPVRMPYRESDSK